MGRGIDLGDVLAAEEISDLGEPEYVADAYSTDSPVNVEVREYPGDQYTVTGPAFNLAKHAGVAASPERGLDDAEDFLRRFKDQFDPHDENPVYVSTDVIGELDEYESVPAYMRFPGDDTAYGATLKPVDDLFRRIDDEDHIQIDDTYRERIIEKGGANNFLIPVLTYTNDDGRLREQVPAAALYQPDTPVVINEGDVDESSPADHALVESYETEDGYMIVIDTPVSADTVETTVTDEGLVVGIDDEPVYVDTDVDGSVSVSDEQQNNGVYQARITG